MGVANYAWGVELKPVGTSGPISLRISDAAVEIPGAQYDPGIERWNAIPLGAAALVNNRYFVPTWQLQLLVRNYSPQEPDDDLITLFQTHDFLQAEAIVYVTDFDAFDETVFRGVVSTIGRITRETVTLTVTAEDSTTVRPSLQLTRALYPSIRQVDENANAPVLVGDVGWSGAILLRDMGPTVAGLAASTDWRFFVPSRGMGPGYVVDTDDQTAYKVKLNSIDAGGQNIGNPGPRNVALWPDDQRSPCELLNATFSSGLLSVTRELAANYPGSVSSVIGPPQGGPLDGQIRVRRCHVPNDVTADTVTAWTNPMNGLDRTDLSSYSEVGRGTSSWQSWYQSEGRFMRYPSRPNLSIRRDDGADPRVVALVWGQSNTGGNLTWELRIANVYNSAVRTLVIDLTAQTAGWAIITFPLTDNRDVGAIAGTDDFIFFQGTAQANRQWWGENLSPTSQLYDHIAVRAPNATAEAASKPRVAMLGLVFEHLAEPGPMTALTKSGYLRGIERPGDNARPATIVCHNRAQNPANPFNVIGGVLTQYSANAKTPIQSGDIATSGVGSVSALDTLLNSNVNGVTGGAATFFELSGAQEADVPLQDTLTILMNSMFVDIWYSPRRGLYCAKAFQAGQAADGATLYSDDIWEGLIEQESIGLDQIYNAIYLSFWKGSRTVSIDTGTFSSRRWDGSRAPVFEADAARSQAAYGKRTLRLELPYIRDSAAAYEVLTRMWGLLREPRPIYRFAVSPEWGLAREQSEVFTTSGELDAILPVPIKGKTSWANLTWQITALGVEPQGAFWVYARYNERFIQSP